ncbi:hypothetical protein BC829DRAFT_408742 [Chytridium lagenaria]|nr:hypothetical protein BC829DRAFT_408742 [Chytridium lagenaria]
MKTNKRSFNDDTHPSPNSNKRILFVQEMLSTPSTSTDAHLRQTLKTQGYLLLRNLLPWRLVNNARKLILEDMNKNEFIRTGTVDGIKVKEDGTIPSLLNRQDLANHPTITALLEHDILYQTVSKILIPDASSTKDSKILSIPFKWLRAVPTNLNTGPHLDRVYLGAGTPHLLTLWMPLLDVPAELGTLVISPDGTKSGWITEDPAEIAGMYGIEEIKWVAADMKMGDVVVLGLDVLHMSSNNDTDRWRVSVETRWQKLGDPYPPWWK